MNSLTPFLAQVSRYVLISAKYDAKAKAAVLTSAAGVALKDIRTVDYSWGEIELEYSPMRGDMLCKSVSLLKVQGVPRAHQRRSAHQNLPAKKSSGDYYDSHNYKSAQDFADNKYEEFYNYEDDYDDWMVHV